MAEDKRAPVERISRETFFAMSDSEQKFTLYTALTDVQDQMISMENDAREMMSPDKLTGLASSFFGMGG